MSLGPADQSKLTRILKIARELELTWPDLERGASRNLAENSLYKELKKEISACKDAEAESLLRLAKTADHLHSEASLHHFYGCLVPFERLAGRALRDDEFLVEEGDTSERTVARVPLKLVVENLRSSFNVGALFRTAECLGTSEIILCGYTPGPDDEKTSRTAMGTNSMVPWRRADRARTIFDQLRSEGYKIVALETAKSAVSLHDSQFYDQKIAFVVGNERFGVETETLQSVDEICRIPVRGMKNSMNVGVAFGIAAFEWLRQNKGAR